MSIIHNPVLFENYENEKLIHYSNYPIDENTRVYDGLSNLSCGIPIINRRIKDNLYMTFIEPTHVLVIGASRSGKSTSFVIPTIFSFADQVIKSSFVVTDPKGEIYHICAKRLKEKGYRVLLINFRDFLHSEYWNPLTKIYDKYIEAKNLDKNVECKEVNGKFSIKYKNETFTDISKFNNRLNRERKILYEEVDNMIDEIALLLIDSSKAQDPYWPESAKILLVAIFNGMLEDIDKEGEGKITRDNFSFKTVIKILAEKIKSNEFSYFTDRPIDSRARILAEKVVTGNADTTRSCILSSLDTGLLDMKESTSKMVTSCNTIDFNELFNSDDPVALFISFRDEVKTSYKIIQILVKDLYIKLIDIADHKENLRLERPFYFMLDEFGNFPAIKDFDTTISACGGRNIWFAIMLQSYAQLYNVYGMDVGNIIKDNLNCHCYFGTNNYETKKAFSEECGRKTIYSPSSALNSKGPNISEYHYETIPLVPISELNRLKPGDCIITRTNVPYVLWSRLERYFMCKEFNYEKDYTNNYQSSVDIFDDKYDYECEYD